MVFFLFLSEVSVFFPCPPVRIRSMDVDLFRLACVCKQEAKEEGRMPENRESSFEWKVGGKVVSEEEFNRAKEPYLLKKCGLVKFGRESGKVDVMMDGTCPVPRSG